MKICVFINVNTNFCNLTGKVLSFKFDAALLNLHIYCRDYLKNNAKLFRFYLKIRHFDIKVFLGIACIANTCISGHCRVKKMTYI